MARRSLVLLVALVLLIAGCGDDDTGADASDNTDPEVETPTDDGGGDGVEDDAAEDDGTEDDADDDGPASASEVAERLASAGLGCEDARPNPQPEGDSEESVLCTVADGKELTIDSFASEDDFDAFVASGEAGCEFYPDTDLPYGAGEWWTMSLSVDFGDADVSGFPREPYEPLVEAAGGEVRVISC